MKRAARFMIILALILVLSGISQAFVREGAVRGRKGLSFSNVKYNFESLYVTINNSTKYNIDFGGSMLFLDRHHRVIARAELMKGRIKRRSSRKYKAFFSEGTGDDAKTASFLEWEF